MEQAELEKPLSRPLERFISQNLVIQFFLSQSIPPKGLKEVLKLKDEDAGTAMPVSDPFDKGDELKLKALLMSPEVTIKRIAEQDGEAASQKTVL